MTAGLMTHCTCAPDRPTCPTCRAWDTISEVLALVRDGAGFDDRRYRTARRALTPRHLRPLSLRLSRIERSVRDIGDAVDYMGYDFGNRAHALYDAVDRVAALEDAAREATP